MNSSSKRNVSLAAMGQCVCDAICDFFVEHTHLVALSYHAIITAFISFASVSPLASRLFSFIPFRDASNNRRGGGGFRVVSEEAEQQNHTWTRRGLSRMAERAEKERESVRTTFCFDTLVRKRRVAIMLFPSVNTPTRLLSLLLLSPSLVSLSSSLLY